MARRGAATNADIEAPMAPGKLYALIVGINRYDHNANWALDGAVRDALTVNDAVGRTHRLAAVDEYKLVITDGESPPRRGVIYDKLQEIARQASERDSVLVYLAGHGTVQGGRAALIPEDGDPEAPESLVWIDQVQRVFDRSPCRRRVLLLDMCQDESLPDETPTVTVADPAPQDGRPEVMEELSRPTDEARARALAPVTEPRCTSQESLDAVHAEIGWMILTSCGAGQQSWESDELGGQGVFSHHVALGLRGDADLNHDGTVGLYELVQYLSSVVPWEARRAQREREKVVGWAFEQVPHVICRGPMTSFSDKGAVAGDARPPDWRDFKRPPGLLGKWLEVLRERCPFEEANNWSWHVPGAGVLYGLLMGLEVLLLFGAGAAQGWIMGTMVALLSGLLWHAMISFSVAAAALRYHHGGYLSGSSMVVWHGLVFTGLAVVVDDTTRVIHFGMAMFFILVVMIVFGFNTLHVAISLLELERRREEGCLRDFFKVLEQKLLRAEIPNPIPCEIFHPKIYLALWPIVAAVLIVHMGAVAWDDHLDLRDGLVLLRDMVLWILVTWLISGYYALYQWLFRRHPKQVKT